MTGGVRPPGRVGPKEGQRAGVSRRIAWLMDDIFRVPGTRLRFGLDPLLGLLPGGGDAVGGALSAWIILAAARYGAPPAVLVRMAGNVALDVVAGIIPVVGDLFDAGWKANRRNLTLLDQYTAAPEPVTRASRFALWAVLAALALLMICAAALTIAVAHALVGLF